MSITICPLTEYHDGVRWVLQQDPRNWIIATQYESGTKDPTGYKFGAKLGELLANNQNLIGRPIEELLVAVAPFLTTATGVACEIEADNINEAIKIFDGLFETDLIWGASKIWKRAVL